MSKNQNSQSSQVQKVKQENTLPTKEYTAEEAKMFVLENTKTAIDPNELLKQFALEYMPNLAAINQEKITEKISEISLALSSDTGFMLMKSVGEEYRGLALQMKRDFQNEFDCKAPSEKALVDLMVNAYIKKLRYSDKMEHQQKYLGHQYDIYRNYLSKEIDRAYRQFISAMETLKALKQPSIKVNVKTNNAFIGEKQQFNNNAENNEAK